MKKIMDLDGTHADQTVRLDGPEMETLGVLTMHLKKDSPRRFSSVERALVMKICTQWPFSDRFPGRLASRSHCIDGVH